MNRKHDISFEIRQAVLEALEAENKRRFLRKLKIWAVLLSTVTAVYAVSITIPNNFSDGDTLSAAKLNENFQALVSKVNTIDTKLERQLGTFCGKTALTYDGAQVAGYTGAKTKCEATCSNPNAHMCSNTEMTNSSQLNITIGAANVWLNMGFNQRGFQYRDCEGWTSNSGTAYGTIWSTTVANDFTCNLTAAIACCL